MIGATDYTGLGVLIAAIGGAVAGIISAIYAGRASSRAGAAVQASTLKDGRTVAEVAPGVEAALTTPPDHPAAGVVLADVAQGIEQIVQTLNGKSPPVGGPPH